MIEYDDKNKQAEEVLKKYDKESNTQEYNGIIAKFITALAISFSIFQLYTAIFGVLDAQLQRAVHLGFGLALVYLLYPTRADCTLLTRYWQYLAQRLRHIF